MPAYRALAGMTKRILLRSRPDLPGSYQRYWVAGVELYVPYALTRDYVLEDFEPETTARLPQVVASGSSCVDVGANIGLYTVLLARAAGRGGRVWALEPAAENMRFLEANVRLNRLKQVETAQLAAGACHRQRSLFLQPSGIINSLYRRGERRRRRGDFGGGGPVPELVERFDFCKIEVEGAELEVLEGMTSVLEEGRVDLPVEWHPRMQCAAGHDSGTLPRRLVELGYRLEVWDDPLKLGTVEDLLAAIDEGRLPAGWYCNLFAQRSAV